MDFRQRAKLADLPHPRRRIASTQKDGLTENNKLTDRSENKTGTDTNLAGEHDLPHLKPSCKRVRTVEISLA